MSKDFKDLGKESKDILSKDFISGNSLIFTGKIKTPNDIEIKGSVKRNFKTDAKTKVTKENVEVLIEPKYEWKHQDVEINGKLSTSRDHSLGFVSKDLFTKGAKIDFQGTSNERWSHLKIIAFIQERLFFQSNHLLVSISFVQ